MAWISAEDKPRDDRSEDQRLADEVARERFPDWRDVQAERDRSQR